MRLPRLTLLLVALACAQTSEPDEPPVGFEHAYAAASCAPWDGYAVSLVLRREALAPGDSAIEEGTAPQLRLALYPREGGGVAPSGVRPGTYRWPREPEVAIGARCQDGQCATMPSGQITVREARSDGRLLGTVDLRLADGSVLRGAFDAEWRPRRWFCI